MMGFSNFRDTAHVLNENCMFSVFIVCLFKCLFVSYHTPNQTALMRGMWAAFVGFCGVSGFCAAFHRNLFAAVDQYPFLIGYFHAMQCDPTTAFLLLTWGWLSCQYVRKREAYFNDWTEVTQRPCDSVDLSR